MAGRNQYKVRLHHLVTCFLQWLNDFQRHSGEHKKTPQLLFPSQAHSMTLLHLLMCWGSFSCWCLFSSNAGDLSIDQRFTSFTTEYTFSPIARTHEPRLLLRRCRTACFLLGVVGKRICKGARS